MGLSAEADAAFVALRALSSGGSVGGQDLLVDGEDLSAVANTPVGIFKSLSYTLKVRRF